MTTDYNARLTTLGLELPEAVAPAANYVPARQSGSLLFIAGQVSVVKGSAEYIGKVGTDISKEDAIQAARACGINILAQLSKALDGDLNRVVRCVRLGGFVNAAPDFTELPAVINGASDLMVEVFGEAGQHARAAVGCSSLPRGVSVEIDAIFEVD